MKKTFQKTLIAAATGVALMSAVGSASANSLLFPYFTTNTGAQSVLSLTASSSVSTSAETIHYVYNYGTGCVHYDANGSLTANDTLSHSIADTTVGGFGKVVGTDKSTPVYFPLAGQTGFLIVTNKVSSAIDAISGSLAIVDPSSGLVVSYPGISNALATDAANVTNEGNFAAITDVRFPLSFLPTGVVTTSWYAVAAGNQYTAITNGANWTGVVTFSNQGSVYDNDEVAISGTATKAITCAGSFAATDLETSAQAAKVGTNGGVIKALVTPSATATGAVLSKLQTVLPAVGAPFAGKQFLHRETVLAVPTALGGLGVGF